MLAAVAVAAAAVIVVVFVFLEPVIGGLIVVVAVGHIVEIETTYFVNDKN